ncbi:MAG TPA: restriction endonuclease subunit S [Pyrinomonadaceae bacterium]|jgi:type I restriction enzyme S subunit
MSSLAQTRPRAFAILFKDLRLWSVGSFSIAEWHWPAEYIKPLSSAMKRVQTVVDRKKHSLDTLQLVTLHFDGTMERRSLDGKGQFKGKLYFAHAGDVIYSKIDVRNGAIGIVPDDMPRVAVSSEYPVYKIDSTVAHPQYVKLLFRTDLFRQTINSMISGASGRKRVQPSQIETLNVPLPPLSIQATIVERWIQIQDDIKAAYNRIEKHKTNYAERFLKDLGFSPIPQIERPRAFAAFWKDIFQWSGRATSLLKYTNFTSGKYPLVSGKECLIDVRHGCSASPSPKPTELEVLKISSVTRGEFVPTAKKYAYDNPRFREEFDLKSGDVLMCRTNGTLGYVGMSALVEKDMEDLIFPDKVIRLRAKENMLSEYLWILLQSGPLRAQIEAAARTAVGNYAIGSEDIWNLKMPLPPFSVQRSIMGRVLESRAEIAREQLAAEQKAREVRAEIEALILGTKSVEDSELAA